MKVVNKRPDELKPYAKNARNHSKKQIKALAESIREFGFNNPILIDEAGMVLAGHGRLEAAKQLQLSKVPCVYVEGLTEEQKKAFILADNKIGEMSTWNNDLLREEINSLPKIDMEGFGFETGKIQMPKIPKDKLYYGEYRETTNRQYNLEYFDMTRADGKFQMPLIRKTEYVPDDLQGFNYIMNDPDYSKGVHFFIDDYQFERIWRSPEMYIEKLKRFPCVLTPDFSLYMDMPIAMKVWNIYRSRMIGQMMQDAGITVIPTLSWAEPETFEFCFDGIEPGGTVAVSTVGVVRDKDALKIWRAGMDEAIRKLCPCAVVVYGTKINGYEWRGMDVKAVEARKGWK